MAARPAASIVVLFCNGWVDFQRTACKTDGRGAVHRETDMAGRIGELMHGLATNSRFESRGAAVRSCGNAWNMDAMAAGGCEEQWLSGRGISNVQVYDISIAGGSMARRYGRKEGGALRGPCIPGKGARPHMVWQARRCDGRRKEATPEHEDADEDHHLW
jgi:hypothetical protein